MRDADDHDAGQLDAVELPGGAVVMVEAGASATALREHIAGLTEERRAHLATVISDSFGAARDRPGRIGLHLVESGPRLHYSIEALHGDDLVPVLRLDPEQQVDRRRRFAPQRPLSHPDGAQPRQARAAPAPDEYEPPRARPPRRPPPMMAYRRPDFVEAEMDPVERARQIERLSALVRDRSVVEEKHAGCAVRFRWETLGREVPFMSAQVRRADQGLAYDATIDHVPDDGYREFVQLALEAADAG